MDGRLTMRVYLGLDASTQSLSAVLLGVESGACRLLGEHVVDYDRDLPAYGTRHGVIRGDDARVFAPPLMWADALDRMMQALMSAEPAAMARLTALSGAAQQHGSVYLTDAGLEAVGRADEASSIGEALAEGGFARALSPVWLDASTGRECLEIEAAVGGREALETATGARAFDRFTAPQIRAFYRRDPAAYHVTARVHLVSSFHASLLAGIDAPLEASEASGTNLMELDRRGWWGPAVQATAPDVLRRLPEICGSTRFVGSVGPYWRARYAVPETGVLAWTGDNPGTLIGSGIVEPGTLSISLGTSDTVCAWLDARPDASGAGYVAASPIGGYLATTTFSNGSLAREAMRERYGLTWADVELALQSSVPDADAGLMLPWVGPEITPRVAVPGIVREHLDERDGVANMRALIEGQMMAIARHTQWMADRPRTISATGGASVNRAILQTLADVFGAAVTRPRASNTSALGAAMRAWHAHEFAGGRARPWSEIADAASAAAGGFDVIEPREAAVAAYARLRERSAKLEKSVLRTQPE